MPKRDIDRLHEEFKLSMDEIAHRVGCSPRTVFGWLREGRDPIRPYLGKIRSVLAIEERRKANHGQRAG